MAYVVMAYVVMALCKGAKIFEGHDGIWHLHYARLAHYHIPQNIDCDPWGCAGVRQCKKNRINLTFSVCTRCGDEVLCKAENAVFGHVQMSGCERA